MAANEADLPSMQEERYGSEAKRRPREAEARSRPRRLWNRGAAPAQEEVKALPEEPAHRARDPGLKLAQIGRVTWVHCPKCDGPAKHDARGAECLRCGYMTIQERGDYPARWGRIRQDDPRCVNCRRPIPADPVPTAFSKEGELYVRVKCPNCAETGDYRASGASPPLGASASEPARLRMFLTTQVAGETLWVDNLSHLEALEAYLGAKLRERGPVPGLTMMARLPAWMKAASAREKILRGLRHLRERAEKAGIDE